MNWIVNAVNLEELRPATQIDTFGTLVTSVVKNAFVLAGVISFVLLIFGGLGVIVAAGDAKKLEESRGRIIGAVVGLLIIIGSFWIIQIIEKITGLSLLQPGL